MFKRANDDYVFMKTNKIVNGVKVVAFLLIIFCAAKVYHDVSFYGLNDLVFISFVLLAGWSYNIKFYETFELAGREIQIIVKGNIFGFSKVFIIDTKLGLLLTAQTRQKYFEFTDDNSSLCISIKLTGNGCPQCKVEKLGGDRSE